VRCRQRARNARWPHPRIAVLQWQESRRSKIFYPGLELLIPVRDRPSASSPIANAERAQCVENANCSGLARFKTSGDAEYALRASSTSPPRQLLPGRVCLPTSSSHRDGTKRRRRIRLLPHPHRIYLWPLVRDMNPTSPVDGRVKGLHAICPNSTPSMMTASSALLPPTKTDVGRNSGVAALRTTQKFPSPAWFSPRQGAIMMIGALPP